MRILFVDGTVGHNPHLLKTRPTGGTLTSLTIVPEGLAAKGHEVYVSSLYKLSGDAEVVNGVNYISQNTQIKKWDITVFNRDYLPEDFVSYCKEQNIKTVCWLHDLVGNLSPNNAAFHNMDAIVGMSEYSIRTYSDYHNVSRDKFTLIPNGIDTSLFYPGKYEERNPDLFLVASAPHRGFETLEVVYKRLKSIRPNLDFRIYSSQSLHHFKNSDTQNAYLQRFKSIGMNVLDPIPQAELADVMRKAWALLMPYRVPETCCNLLLQANACALPTLSTNIGANKEWIKNGVTGLLTSYMPVDFFNWIKDCEDKAAILTEQSTHKNYCNNLLETYTASWQHIIDMWESFLLKLGENK